MYTFASNYMIHLVFTFNSFIVGGCNILIVILLFLTEPIIFLFFITENIIGMNIF